MTIVSSFTHPHDPKEYIEGWEPEGRKWHYWWNGDMYIKWKLLRPIHTGRRLQCLTSSLTLNGGGRIFHSPSSPLFSLLALLSRLIYWETLSARLSKLKDYGFDQLVSQRNWHHLLDEKPGFWGTCLPWRNVRSWLHDGRMGEVENHMSSGSFRGGRWRYLHLHLCI